MPRAWLTLMLLAGCARPPAPGRAPSPPRAKASRRHAAPVGRAALIGFVCPTAAEGRPAFLAGGLRRGTDWTAQPDELRDVLARGLVHELDVLGYAGRRAGRFTPLGPVALARDGVAALGAYAGSLPCFDKATAADCELVTRGCGLAAGATELDEAPRLPTGAGCAAGGNLVVDIDGDHIAESLPLADLAALLEEIGSAPAGGVACEARFAGPLAPDLDLLGVADLDLDGRMEIAVGRRAARVVAIYSARGSAQRLVRVALLRL